ncbi:hypothetical protein [Streptomyces sp. NPDC002159]
MFAFMRALTAPTSLLRRTGGQRTGRAATELAVLMKAGVGTTIADLAWGDISTASAETQPAPNRRRPMSTSTPR